MTKDASARGRASRNKGKVGEREVAALLRKHGFDAHRAQQYCGGNNSDDVTCEALAAGYGFHIEVKRTERASLREWMAQTQKDAAPGRDPLIAHRWNGGEWIAILPLEKLLGLLSLLEFTGAAEHMDHPTEG